MAVISVKELLEAGVHFGHRVSRWNPKMAPYIFCKRNLIHIINLRETVKGLIKAHHFLQRLSMQGEEVIFVGTKRQAKNVMKKLAESCEMHYVAERWLGGSLTNFETIRKRLARLEELDKMETDGTMEGMGKKYASSLRREKKKINRNLEGIKRMEKLPGALIIVDPKKEHIAVKEASKLGIPTICLIDTDSDPDLVDIPIPANEDAMRSIEVICSKLAEAIIAGRTEWKEQQKAIAKAQEGADKGGEKTAEADKLPKRSDSPREKGRGGRRDNRRSRDGRSGSSGSGSGGSGGSGSGGSGRDGGSKGRGGRRDPRRGGDFTRRPPRRDEGGSEASKPRPREEPAKPAKAPEAPKPQSEGSSQE